jgi:hypothetical protein
MGNHPDTQGGGSQPPPEPERRAHPRFLFPSSASCRARPFGRSDWWPGKGLDVSLAGLAVRLPQPPASGQLLVVELQRMDPGLLLLRLLRVVYCCPIRGGGYRVGGQFLRMLALDELEQLLQCPGVGAVAELALSEGPQHP